MRTFDGNWKQGLTREDYYYAWEKEVNRNLAEVNRLSGDTNNDFYRVCLYGDAIHNSDAYFGYYGITDFNSAENEALRVFMHNMGFYTTTRRTGGTGLTPPMQMILSIKNTARLYVDMAVAGIDTDLRVYDNPYNLPIGFMTESDILEDMVYSNNVFDNQNELIRRMSGVENLYEPVQIANMDIKDGGLMYSKEGKNIYRTSLSGGEMTLAFYDIEDDVFIQLLTNEEGKQSATGLEWGLFMNQASSLDYKLNVPFAVQTVAVGNNHMTTIEADDSFVGPYQLDGIVGYRLNKEKLSAANDILASECLLLEKYENGYVKGKVWVEDNRRVLFTSIPYTDGWIAKINGEECEIIPVCNGAFCALIIPHVGKYEVEFAYHCPGAVGGLLISLAGLIILVIVIYLNISSRTKSTNKEM